MTLSIFDSNGGLCAKIRPRKGLWIIAELWILCFSVFGVLVLKSDIRSWVWTLLGIVVGLAAIQSLEKIAYTFGRLDTITIDQDKVQTRRSVFGVVIHESYFRKEQILDIHPVESGLFGGRSEAAIHLNVDGKNIEFAKSLKVEEAQEFCQRVIAVLAGIKKVEPAFKPV